MFCKFCGKEIDNDASFCSYCGNNLQQNSKAAEIQAALEWKQAQKDYKEQMNQRIARQAAESDRASGRSARPRPNLDVLKDNSRFCSFCGAKIDGDSAFCPSCGRSLSGSAPQTYQPQPQMNYQTQAAPAKPVYKRWWFWVLMIPIVLVILFILVGSFSSDENAEQQISTEPISREEFVPVETKPLDSKGSVGKYAVEIKDFEIVKDYSDNPAILVSYSFTNNSEENATAMFSLATYAYQNGIQLESAIIADGDIYSSEDKMKEVKPGVTIDVKDAYALVSETAPVGFEVAAAFSFSDDRLGKNFILAEDGITELVQAPEGEETFTIDDCDFSIVSYEIVKDYDGNNAIMLTIGFTNYSDKDANYLGTISLSAFQDGVELETAFLPSDVDRDSGASMRNVKPGAGLAVYPAYVLTSDTAPVEIEFTEFMSFSDDVIETVIHISE